MYLPLTIQSCVISELNKIMLCDLLLSFPTRYDNKEIALNCGNMLRECIKFSTLAK